MHTMTFNQLGIGEVLRVDDAGNFGIGYGLGSPSPGSVYRVTGRIWSSEPGVLNSWRIMTSDPEVSVWLDQHSHRGTHPVGWPEWTVSEDQYVMFLLRWGTD
jgi:hypothetical protein